MEVLLSNFLDKGREHVYKVSTPLSSNFEVAMMNVFIHRKLGLLREIIIS
jgi:hypothetical protein